MCLSFYKACCSRSSNAQVNHVSAFFSLLLYYTLSHFIGQRSLERGNEFCSFSEELYSSIHERVCLSLVTKSCGGKEIEGGMIYVGS
jgi:hypothetical protein